MVRSMGKSHAVASMPGTVNKGRRIPGPLDMPSISFYAAMENLAPSYAQEFEQIYPK